MIRFRSAKKRGPDLRLSPLAAALLLICFGTDAARAQLIPIFSDGFESGDTTEWTLSVGVEPASCESGLALTGLLAGDLGDAPAGPYQHIGCLEARNDLGSERTEIAYSGVPLPRLAAITSTDQLVLVGPGGRRVAAQLDPLSRWGSWPDDPSAPIRWLQVAAPVRVGGSSSTIYSLRRYTGASAPADVFAASITAEGGGPCDSGSVRCLVDTGVATFTLDPSSPALLERIAVDLDDDGVGQSTEIYQHVPGAGPRLRFNPGGGPLTLDTGSGQVSVDPGSFEVTESGPVKITVKLSGHFSSVGGASLCTATVPAGMPAYESFGFTAAFTFTRASRNLDVYLVFRNECSDAFGGPWFDQDAEVLAFSWELPFDLSAPQLFYGASGAVTALGGASDVAVEQTRGGGAPWSRRARVLQDGSPLPAEAGEQYAAPVVALADGSVSVVAQMPWLRYREPQGLVASVADGISLRFISDHLNVGEGKGIWGEARLGVSPTAAAGASPGQVETLRAAGLDRLERGLIFRPLLQEVNQTRIFPSLGHGGSSEIKTHYQQIIGQLHAETVGGAWDRGKVFGSQLWPDTTADPYAIGELGVDEVATPNDFSPNMNYWDPLGAELLEFLRSGDPKWVWDFALPAARLQLHTAYLNIGEHQHGNRAGVAVTSGGPGCELDASGFPTACTADGTGGGEWHRTELGSDDYTYDMGLELAYALRPDPIARDRFRQAGRMISERYDEPQGNREVFVSAVDVNRQVVQHFEMLANCAEFVPAAELLAAGGAGSLCHQRLIALVDELTSDNLALGVLCQGDADGPLDFPTSPTDPFCGPSLSLERLCSTPQQFMQNALIYPFFHRVYRNYGEGGNALADPQSLLAALVDAPRVLYEQGIAQDASGAIDVLGNWAPRLECGLEPGTSNLVCVPAPDSDNQCGMYLFNKPHTAALLLMAHELDPSVGLCEVTKAALDDPDLAAEWDDLVSNEAGWWKGASQMMQSMVFGVGIYDTCQDPAAGGVGGRAPLACGAPEAGGSTAHRCQKTRPGLRWSQVVDE